MDEEVEVKVKSKDDNTLPSGRGLSNRVSVKDSEGKNPDGGSYDSKSSEVASVGVGTRSRSAARMRGVKGDSSARLCVLHLCLLMLEEEDAAAALARIEAFILTKTTTALYKSVRKEEQYGRMRKKKKAGCCALCGDQHIQATLSRSSAMLDRAK